MAENFPNIRKAVEEAHLIKLSQPGLKVYRFRTFAFGEKGTQISYKLLTEITDGLCDSVRGNFSDFDYIVSPEPSGHTWGSLVALRLGKSLNILRLSPSYEKTEQEVWRKTGYCQHNLYFNHFQKGDRVLVVDDIVSTGGSLDAILSTFQNLGVIPVGVQVIYAKSGDYEKIEGKFSVSIKALIYNSE